MSNGLKINKYRRDELMGFIESSAYKMLNKVPISNQRAISHINNPRADADDLILITASQEGSIIAYRTVMADWVFNGSRKIKVGWISGTWVSKDFRRQGLATLLFDEIYKEWKGTLMYTNYAPASKIVYDKTGAFETYAHFNGRRFYFRSNLQELLPARWPVFRIFKSSFVVFDRLFNLFIRAARRESGLIKTSGLDEQQVVLLTKGTLTNRSVLEFEWIRNFPWVLDKEALPGPRQDYFFSSVASPFEQFFLTERNEVIIMITIKGRQMKVPYCYFKTHRHEDVVNAIITQALEYKISHLDIYDETLIKLLTAKRKGYLFSKLSVRKYMVSKALINSFPSSTSVRIPDGEGDVVFV